MKNDNNGVSKQAVINLEGATCGSCIYTIEHAGKKIHGVHDVHVDVPSGKILVDYEGDSRSLDSIIQVVEKLGYSAHLTENHQL